MSVYVFVTEPSRERHAMAQLIDAGFSAYVPMWRRWSRINGHRIRRVSAVFPGYVFLWSDDINRDFAGARHSRYVIGTLGSGGTPKPMDNVDWLVRCMLAHSFGLFDYTRDRRPKMTIGQAVRLIAGPFQGYLASVVELRDGDRKVVIEVKGGRGRMTIDAEKLEAAA